MDLEKTIIGLIMSLCGIFCFVCAFKDYDWFMGHPKAKFIVGLLGRGKTRVFYMLLGTVLVIAGGLGAMGTLGPIL